MDRTNWKYGKKDVNYLVVSVAWQGVSIPIVWQCLDNKGGSCNTQQRIDLMERVLDIIPANQIDQLLGDREFIGKLWLNWLKYKKIVARIRVKNNTKIIDKYGKKVRVSYFFRHVEFHQRETWCSRRTIGGVALYVAATRSVKELVVVVSTEKPKSIITDYRKRWCIETLFGCLKSRGFDIESTHMTIPERMDKLMAILALAFLWCISVGYLHFGSAAELPLNKNYRPEKSLFRLGLDLLRRILKNCFIREELPDFTRVLAVLSRT